MAVDVRKAVFITPMGYEVNEKLENPDYCLHGGLEEAQLLDNGGIFVVFDLPLDKFSTTQDENAVKGKTIHYQTLMGPDGRRFFPLFDSYKNAVNIFGKNIRFAMSCYDTAIKMAKEENLSGIVIGPGTSNIMLPIEKLT